MRYLLPVVIGLFFSVGCATSQKKLMSKIEGKTHKGENVSIDLEKKKATVVVFLSARCPCSNSNSALVEKLAKKYSDFQFVGIHSNYDEPLGLALSYFGRKDFNFPVIYDQETELAKKFGALKTPHVFIINHAGEVIYNGSVSSSTNADLAKEIYLDIALADIREGKEPAAPKKKTLGCYINIKS